LTLTGGEEGDRRMRYRTRSRPFFPLIFLVLAALTVVYQDQAGLAVSEYSEKTARSPSVRPASMEQWNTWPMSSRGKKAVRGKTRKKAVSPSPKRSLDKPVAKKSRSKRSKKHLRSPAVTQSKPALSHHGILQQPRRYDPFPTRGKGTVPHPGAKEVRHDHFRELARTRDGVIDPFERVSGRLDIDRDIPNNLRD